MLNAYFEGFESFLKTGNTDLLARFMDADSNLSVLNVYRNGYLKTCTETLASSYPVVNSLVGPDYFRGIARAYIEAYPPTAGTLVGYGSRFTEFLRSRTDEHGLAYLPDAAAIDSAWLVSYFAEAGVALTPKDIEAMSSKTIDVSTVSVSLTPTTQLVRLKHHIVETWALIRDQGALNKRVSLRAGDSVAMLWRIDGRIHIKELELGESRFVSTIARVSTLEAAANSAFEVDESFNLATTFAALLENKILQLQS